MKTEADKALTYIEKDETGNEVQYSGSVLPMPRDMKNQPQRSQKSQRSQRINDILCEIRDPGGFTYQRKGVETKAKDILTIPGIVPQIVASAGIFSAQDDVGLCGAKVKILEWTLL